MWKSLCHSAQTGGLGKPHFLTSRQSTFKIATGSGKFIPLTCAVMLMMRTGALVSSSYRNQSIHRSADSYLHQRGQVGSEKESLPALLAAELLVLKSSRSTTSKPSLGACPFCFSFQRTKSYCPLATPQKSHTRGFEWIKVTILKQSDGRNNGICDGDKGENSESMWFLGQMFGRS